MGLYDEIRIDNKWLPKSKRMPQDKQNYQSKSLDCLLDVYDILEDGKLVKSVIDDDDHVFENVNYNGEIRFYNEENDFLAWCVNGVVKEVIDLNL